MANLECCGVENYKDFEVSSAWNENKGNRTVPEACCILSDKTKFIPKDSSCPSSPSDTNSYLNKVRIFLLISYFL